MLLQINDNLLINPKCISVVEIKKVRGKLSVVLWVEGRSYNILDNEGKFLAQLKVLDQNDKKQFFAG